MESVCGVNCNECSMNTKCNGCVNTNGCPFGKKCFIARYLEIGGIESLNEFKNQLISEVNSIDIIGMPKITDLNSLIGSFINLEYQLPNGNKVKLLDDNEIYFGNQVECEFNDDSTKKCFGIVANASFILVCEYEEDGHNPELLVYKKR